MTCYTQQLTDYTWELQLWRWPPQAFPDDRAAGASQYWTGNWSVMDESTWAGCTNVIELTPIMYSNGPKLKLTI